MTYWILAALSIAGVVLNIKKMRVCFVVWGFTNFAWMVVNIKEEMYALATLFGVYFVLALWGMYEWKNKKGGKDDSSCCQ